MMFIEQNLVKMKKHIKPVYKHGGSYRPQLLVRLGSCCARCGFSDVRALQVDHIHGDAKKDGCGGGQAYYLHILRELDSGVLNKYQLLCANCNWIKRVENKEARGANQHAFKRLSMLNAYVLR